MGSFTGFLPIFGSFLGDFFLVGSFLFLQYFAVVWCIFGRSMNASLSEIMQKYEKMCKFLPKKKTRKKYAKLYKNMSIFAGNFVLP